MIHVTVDAGGDELWAAVQAIGSIVAILAAGSLALFQHWSNHDVARASARDRLNKLAQLCDLIVVEATLMEADAGEQYDAFHWAHLRADREALTPLLSAVESLDLLTLPDAGSMSAARDLSRALRDLQHRAEALSRAALNHDPGVEGCRAAVRRQAELVNDAADMLKASLR